MGQSGKDYSLYLRCRQYFGRHGQRYLLTHVSFKPVAAMGCGGRGPDPCGTLQDGDLHYS